MLHLLGVSHRTANAELRERLALPEADLPALLDRLGHVVSEVSVLSTCNRVEIYAVAPHHVAAELMTLLAEYTGVVVGDIQDHAFILTDEEAARHLIHVAAGIDSVVIGESQILGQLRHAWDLARQAGHTHATLNTLFRIAIEAGKDIRSRTKIGHGATSVAHAAVELARLRLKRLADARVAILGAGEMGRLAALNLRHAGVGQLLIVNRTPERAVALAADLNAVSLPLAQLGEAIDQADLLITSAAVQAPVVKADMLSGVMRQRPGRPLLVMDIAMPRNVEPAARAIPDLTLYDMDDIQVVCERNRHARSMAAQTAQQYVDEWTSHFIRWQRERGSVELIRRLRVEAEIVRAGEVARTLRGLPDLTDQERLAIEAMSRALVNRLLHPPTIWLKEHSSDSQRQWLDEMWLLGRRRREKDDDRNNQP